MLDHVQSASSYLAATPGSSGREFPRGVKEGEKRVAHRNKPAILIVDSADDGWENVNEYQRRDLVGDSDDYKTEPDRSKQELLRNEGPANFRRAEILLDLRMILSTLSRFLDFNP